MVYFRRYREIFGVEFGAIADRVAYGGIFSTLADGWRAEYLDDVELVRGIINNSIEDLMPEHALAVSCVDLDDIVTQISEDYDTDGGDVFRWLYDEVLRKVYFALLDWGDGGACVGQVARYNNAVGNHVAIEYREGWKR